MFESFHNSFVSKILPVTLFNPKRQIPFDSAQGRLSLLKRIRNDKSMEQIPFDSAQGRLSPLKRIRNDKGTGTDSE
jgi:hypothetical protein